MSSKKPKVAALQMKPTTVSTGFGTGSFDPSTGNVGYTLADPLAQLRDVFYGASQDFLPSDEQQAYAQQVGDYGRGLFTGATQYSIPEMTSQYYNQQQDILTPGRERESAQLADAQFKTGRLGYGAGTQGGYINPQQFALQQAREQQNAQLSLSAEDRARAIQQQDITRGLGLIDSETALRMNPYSQASSLFGLGTGIENLGYGTLNAVGQFAPMQANWQQALQANQQAQNNAKASGGFMGGLGGTLLNAGLNYATGGLSSGLQSSFGGNPFSYLGQSIGGLFGGGDLAPSASYGGILGMGR